MSQLDRLLDSYSPPPAPADLAARAAASAVRRPQRRLRMAMPWRRGDRRGGWKRQLLAASAVAGFAFTSAVAATVVSGGRIDIPVVRDVVAAVPMLSAEAEQARHVVAPARPRAAEREPAIAEAQPDDAAQAQAPGAGRERIARRLAAAKQIVEQRRAAGLPTPRADRIEAQAKRIVERRQAAGKPVPPVEQVEGLLALRELGRMGRQGMAIDPATITDEQVARFIERLPADRRERFLALSPEMQRQLIARTVERLRARRAIRQSGIAAAEGSAQP